MAEAATSKNGNGASSPEANYDELSKDLLTLKADLSRLTETLGKLGGEERDRLVAAAKAQGDALKSSGEAYLRDGERYIRKNPGAALGIAAGIGFLAGFLMTSRR